MDKAVPCPYCFGIFLTTKSGKYYRHGWKANITRTNFQGFDSTGSNRYTQEKAPCPGSGECARDINERKKPSEFNAENNPKITLPIQGKV